MTKRTINLDQPLYDYLLAHSLNELPLLQQLREETSTLRQANMQISPDQGQFMALLVKLLQAKRLIEVGVFTGYSALVTALALPDEGRIVACDISQEWTDIGRRYWQQAGVDHKIDLRLQPALATLGELQHHSTRYDMAFIDADKANYYAYYQAILPLLRSNGLIIIDNVLWDGRVCDLRQQDEDTRAIRHFNQALATDRRVEVSMIPVGDGLTLIRKC